jgi:hypothetical protein
MGRGFFGRHHAGTRHPLDRFFRADPDLQAEHADADSNGQKDQKTE